MELSELQREILYNAWCLSLKDAGQVLEAFAYPAAHELCERGWLRREVEEDGEISWWWTGRASTALELDALVSDQSVN